MRGWKLFFLLLLVTGSAGVVLLQSAGLYGQTDPDGPQGDNGDSTPQTRIPDSGDAPAGSGTVVLSLNQHLYSGRGNAFRVAAPGGAAVDYNVKVARTGADSWIFNHPGNKSLLWNARTGAVSTIPHAGTYYGTALHIAGLSLGFDHAFTKTLVKVSRRQGTVTTDGRYGRFNSTQFFFLPDGQHLFTHVPGLGQRESIHFIDLVPGRIQTLYYSASYPGTPRVIRTRDAMYQPTLVDGGRYAVYWCFKGISADKERRTLGLEAVDVKSGRIIALATFAVAARGPEYNGRRSYLRGVPEAVFYADKPFVLYKKTMDEDAGEWYLYDLAAARERKVAAGTDWLLIQPLGGRFTFGAHVLFGRAGNGTVSLKALSLPSFTPLYRASFVPPGQSAVNYLRSSSVKGDYLP